MKLAKNTETLTRILNQVRESGKTIGFVPTMGALHQGHISLVQEATKQTDYVVVCIFVNPTQFNNKTDLQKYPRLEAEDLALLQQNQCDLVFMPTEKDIYPEVKIKYLDIDLGVLDTVMEGKQRPGHFAGVALVVRRLFDFVQADTSFFGEKDFQQLAVIRSMAEQTNDNIQIVGCPTMRETDGLAMSSRNLRLTPEHRAASPKIWQALSHIKDNNGKKPLSEVLHQAITKLTNEPLFQLEYLEIVDQQTLLPVTTWSLPNTLVVCVALWAGDVRLIDNIQL